MGMGESRTVSIFISSPGDVAEERAISKCVIQRLQGEFSGQVQLSPIYWEHEPLLATKSFQEQIVRPSETDIVVTILWSRLGTRLPADIVKPDGSRYESGTEYEFEDAVTSFRETGSPDVLIYRKTVDPVVSLKDRHALLERLHDKEALDGFFDKWFYDRADSTLIAAFHPFDTPADFEEILESHLRKLVLHRLPEMVMEQDAPAVQPRWREGSPFRGLNVFEFEHAPVFFGRTKAVSEVIAALRTQSELGKAFVLIMGMSGGGKSSLARAGVLPMLTQPGVVGSVALWRRAIMKPSDSPGDLIGGMAACLIREEAVPELVADGADVEELASLLRDSPQAAAHVIKGGLSRAAAEMATREKLEASPAAGLVLLVDQLEEMFSLGSITHEDRVRFFDALNVLARCGRVWVIATLRSDYYPRCAELEALVELKEGAGQYDLLMPTPAEIGQMIRLPAREAGLSYEEDVASNDRLDDVLRDAATSNPGALPLLEFTLEELSKQRTADGMLSFAAYDDLGGVEGALARRAEDVYLGLEPTVRAVMDVELHSLISIGVDEGGGIARKYVALDQVTATDEARAFVEAFVNARLFTTDLNADGSATVSIAHEALLHHWPRLRDWIEKNRESLRIRTRIARAARRWQKEGESGEYLLGAGKPVGEARELLANESVELTETERSFISSSMDKWRRVWWLKRIVVAALAILAVLAGGAAWLADKQRNRAEIEAHTSRQVTEFIVDLFEVSNPSEALGDTIAAREILDRGAERIERELSGQPEVQATLMNTMGQVYMNLGLYAQAAPLLEKALATRRRLHGDVSVEVAECANDMATLHQNRADYPAAEPLFREALATRRRLLGDDHDDVATSLNNLAALLHVMGEYAEAESIYVEALELRRGLFGTGHPGVAEVLSNYGDMMFGLGRLAEADSMLGEALAIGRQTLDGDHPHLVVYMSNRASLLQTMGSYAEAESLFLEILEISKRVFGDEHPEVSTSLNNLASLLAASEDYAAAESLYKESLAMNRRLLGDVHPYVAGSLNNMAQMYGNTGRFAEAETLYNECLEINMALFGGQHTYIATTLNNLAMVQYQQGNVEEAEATFRRALAMRRDMFGEDHPDVATNLGNLAILLMSKQDYEGAESAFTKAVEIWEKVLPGGHWITSHIMSGLGECLVLQERYREAEPLLLAAYPHLEEVLGPDSRYTMSALGKIIRLYDMWGKPERAAEYRALLPDSTDTS